MRVRAGTSDESSGGVGRRVTPRGAAEGRRAPVDRGAKSQCRAVNGVAEETVRARSGTTSDDEAARKLFIVADRGLVPLPSERLSAQKARTLGDDKTAAKRKPGTEARQTEGKKRTDSQKTLSRARSDFLPEKDTPFEQNSRKKLCRRIDLHSRSWA